MAPKITAVINTLNAEKDISRAILSVAWVDEILVCDMESEDNTVKIARKLGARVVGHKKADYVELARNATISKASHEWILILDPDEEVTKSLADKLCNIAKENKVDFVEVPRKNLIFNKWMKASMWWPDLNVRFFKKGAVTWGTKIHFRPETRGEGLKLPNEEEIAIVHHHYSSVSQFLMRMDRYTTAQAKNLQSEGVQFQWRDLLQKPLNEFLSRFFDLKGFEDGLHGLGLSLLQAFSFVVVYLKLWEMQGFSESKIELSEIEKESGKLGSEIRYWFKYGNLPKNLVKRFFRKVVNKFR